MKNDKTPRNFIEESYFIKSTKGWNFGLSYASSHAHVVYVG